MVRLSSAIRFQRPKKHSWYHCDQPTGKILVESLASIINGQKCQIKKLQYFPIYNVFQIAGLK